MTRADSEGDAHIQLVLALIFVLMVVGGVVDLILDRPRSLWTAHVVFEVALVLVSLLAASYLARGWYSASTRLRRMERTVEEQGAERDAWRARAGRTLAGFRDAIDEQFDVWGLTPTERDVGLALLAGRSLKRIARESRRSERTIRQHAIAVYRKAGLSGRAELAGFFLGDLLPGPRASD